MQVGSGTDPAEGAALAGVLLDRLADTACLTYATTHHAQLKDRPVSLPNALCPELSLFTTCWHWICIQAFLQGNFRRHLTFWTILVLNNIYVRLASHRHR